MGMCDSQNLKHPIRPQNVTCHMKSTWVVANELQNHIFRNSCVIHIAPVEQTNCVKQTRDHLDPSHLNAVVTTSSLAIEAKDLIECISGKTPLEY